MAEGTGRGEAALRIAFNLFQPPQAAVQNRKIQTEDRATALSVHAVLLDGVTIAATLLSWAAVRGKPLRRVSAGGGPVLGGMGLLCRHTKGI